MGIMCNMSHDACCDLEMMDRTGALQNVLQQVCRKPLMYAYRLFAAQKVDFILCRQSWVGADFLTGVCLPFM